MRLCQLPEENGKTVKCRHLGVHYCHKYQEVLIQESGLNRCSTECKIPFLDAAKTKTIIDGLTTPTFTETAEGVGEVFSKIKDLEFDLDL